MQLKEAKDILIKLRKNGNPRKFPNILDQRIYNLRKFYSKTEISRKLELSQSVLARIIKRVEKNDNKIACESSSDKINFIEVPGNVNLCEDETITSKMFMKLTMPNGSKIELYQ